MSTYDVVYWWRGGSEYGSWLPAYALPGPDGLKAQAREIERMGYVTRLGKRSIGPPETPPSLQEIQEAIGSPYRPVT